LCDLLFGAMPAEEEVDVSEKEEAKEGDEGMGGEEEDENEGDQENNMTTVDSKEANQWIRKARCASRCDALQVVHSTLAGQGQGRLQHACQKISWSNWAMQSVPKQP
jgi:hypothetical protein